MSSWRETGAGFVLLLMHLVYFGVAVSLIIRPS